MKTRKTWEKHPNLHIIGNETLFNDKIEKAKNTIRSYLGEKEVIRKERYVVNINDIDVNKISTKAIKEDLEEFYLSYDNDKVYVYSKSTINGTIYYYCISYFKEKNGSYKTVCHTITKRGYNENLAKLSEDPIKEVRYHFMDNEERYRLTLYLLGDEWFGLLERDVTNEKRKKLPSFIRNAINITNNSDYNIDNVFIDDAVQKVFKKEI